MAADALTPLREQLLQLQQLHQSGALDAAAYDAARAALERRIGDALLAEPPPPRAGARLWTLVTAASAALAVAGYLWTGSPALVARGAGATAAAAAGSAPQGQLDRTQIEAMVAKLTARLAEAPDDAPGWTMLGRSYMVLDRYAEAAAAYDRARKLTPDDAGVLSEQADAMAAGNAGQFDAQATRMVERALQIEPDNLKALMLAGTAAFNGGDYATAVRHWDRMARVGPADHPWVQQAAEGAAEARRRGALPAPAAALARAAPAASGAGAAPAASAALPTAAAGAATAAAITGTVTLAPALRTQAAADDTLFVYARAAEGPRLPLAILRKQVKDLPLDFRLDDSQSMSPQFRLSTAAGPVIVAARISKSGQALPQPGDLEGTSAPLAVGASGVRITIAGKLP